MALYVLLEFVLEIKIKPKNCKKIKIKRRHHDGRMFFIDHQSRQTTWEDPRINKLMGGGPAVPYSRDYKKKYEFFRNKMKRNFTSAPGQRFDIKGLCVLLSDKNSFKNNF